jgi:uncharacterized lipoprotein YehR (DUF1307 family)
MNTPFRSLIVLTKTSALLLVVVLVCSLAACGNNKPFDSAAWLKGDMRARGRMCEDLVKRKMLIGQTAEEAQRLLGKPDKDYGSTLSYKIDLGWPFKDAKHYGLLVYLNENRNVHGVQIVD